MMILGENVEQIENRKERQNLHSDMYLTHGSKGPLKIISSSHYLSIVMNHEAGDLNREEREILHSDMIDVNNKS
ncbi:uncharacterized protein LOC116850310 isoform X2 [Odontomachus brunneus]|uniref:uncharacterized protein LOC116850310 isoform X2 n=1 Tax=Odontomachus brunneus TaxID=486640 RepID=UPI0013F2960A|nr:uncharacterized protein LOC116850310 isoform X2 [Odontomachus brunneus]